MDQNTLFILCVIGLAYAFDFINGFHDAANSIATIVTTGVLSPRQAVIWAAFFNFIGFIFFNLMVAEIIGNGLIDSSMIDLQLIFAALLGAIFWNLLTWYLGLPSSSSHALIGGLTGAAVAKGSFSVLKLSGFIKVIIGMCLSPIIGLLAGCILTLIFSRLFKNTSEEKQRKHFVRWQLASSALLSLTHGGNDAQKTMGVIALILFSASWIQGAFYVPLWVIFSCQLVISLGTLMGGWRIVKTMGTKITHLDTLRGCAAETGAAAIIFAATDLGIPVSTTQTVTGSIAGVGVLNGIRNLHWPMLKTIVLSWVLTIPMASLVSWGLYSLIK